MSYWNVSHQAQAFSGDDETDSSAVVCTAHASANTKATSYTTVIAVTPRAASGLMLHFGVGSASDYLIDIAIGAAAAEVNIIDNFLWTDRGASNFDAGTVFIPLEIPAGVRLSARVQATTGGTAVRVGITLVSAGFIGKQSLQVCTTYGAATGDSGGTSIDPGGTANTFGAWVQISAAVTRPIRYLVICLGNQANTDRLQASYKFEVGTGAGAAEVTLVPSLYFMGNSVVDNLFPRIFAFPCHVPLGARVAVRAMSSINDATDRLFDVVLIGVS